MFCRTIPFAVALLLLLATTGCVKPQKPGPDSTFAAIEQELDSATRTSRAAGPPPEVMAALLPPLDLPPPASSRQRFDIAVHDLDARTFFMGLVQDSGENMLVHPEVSGNISLNLRNVTIAETMDMVRDVYGYDFRRTPAGWQVFPSALQSRLFVLNNLHLTRTGTTETHVSAGGLKKEGTTGSGGAGHTSGSSSKITTKSETDFWSELTLALNSIVGTNGGRSIQVNPNSGIIMARALPGEIREVDSFLQAIQINVSRQVILEAKILEVELSDGFQSGINWYGLALEKEHALRRGSSMLGSFVGGSEIAPDIGLFNTPELASAAQTLRETGAFPFFSAAIRIHDFAAFIELLETQGNVHVLSSPRVATMNNQKALIKIGQDEFFVSDISTDYEWVDLDRRLVTTPTLSPFFSGIALDVTPTIAEDGMVMLHVRPLISEVRQQNKIITLDGRTTQLPMALSTIRESDTIVRAQNGQIIVIGGLMQDVQRDEQAGIPGLSRIPLLGNLFRHQSKQRTKTELVILLRPIVVDSEQVWTDALGSATERLRNVYP